MNTTTLGELQELLVEALESVTRYYEPRACRPYSGRQYPLRNNCLCRRFKGGRFTG